MVDLQVAYDKLAQFETAEEIATFLRGYGIKAYRRKSTTCAVAMFLEQMTGSPVSVGPSSIGLAQKPGTIIVNNTKAIEQFIIRFDLGHYPDLIADDDNGDDLNDWLDVDKMWASTAATVAFPDVGTRDQMKAYVLATYAFSTTPEKANITFTSITNC